MAQIITEVLQNKKINVAFGVWTPSQCAVRAVVRLHPEVAGSVAAGASLSGLEGPYAVQSEVTVLRPDCGQRVGAVGPGKEGGLILVAMA